MHFKVLFDYYLFRNPEADLQQNKRLKCFFFSTNGSLNKKSFSCRDIINQKYSWEFRARASEVYDFAASKAHLL